jgi:hypothetical protein
MSGVSKAIFHQPKIKNWNFRKKFCLTYRETAKKKVFHMMPCPSHHIRIILIPKGGFAHPIITDIWKISQIMSSASHLESFC